MSIEFNNEHQYIQQQIIDRWWNQVEQVIHPLQDQVRSLLLQGRYKEVQQMEQELTRLCQQLLNERTRGEDILRWLKLDSDLRNKSGITLPDCFETRNSVLSKNENF
jgi:hypothetical protein